MNQSICRLVQKGHSLEDIGNYSLGTFVRFLEATAQLEAADRAGFVTDLSVVIGSLFSGGKSSPAVEHLGLLADAAAGVKHG